MKSDESMMQPFNMRGEFTENQRILGERAGSPVPSCLSMKSDESMMQPFNFRGEVTENQRILGERAGSPVPSCLSMKSDESLMQPFNFRGEVTEDQRILGERAGSPVPSCLSMKSDESMMQPFNMRGEFTENQRILGERAGSPVPSCLSMKSDESMMQPFNFRGEVTENQRIQPSLKFSLLDEKSSDKLAFNKQSPLMKLKKDELHNEPFKEVQQALKSHLKRKLESIFEGLAKQGHPTLLNEIYTELYITEGGSGGVNSEHEVRQIEAASRRQTGQETAILSNDIFKPLPGQRKPIRTVLTKGIAGIGKTVSVQKFILDWAEGKANQDIDLIFTLPFRDLNLKKEREFSLMQLLWQYAPQLREIKSVEVDELKVVFIFDGLDECRLPLDFQTNEICCDTMESSSVDAFLTNLIRGNLLPSALLWITSRPAAANQIPPECVHRVTEVRGFNDPQKEEYFRKRIRDQNQASRIISHIKSSKSLFIMCHIPVFCWISASVLETMLGKVESGDLPKTLTEMYTHFLLIQTNLKNQKYHGNGEINPKVMSALDTEIILKFGQLAFLQLENGNLIFYEEDLKESGIDVSEASVYSGVCTEIFKVECGLYQEKVYCFVHLSIQEYLAALFVFHSCVNENRNVLKAEESYPPCDRVQLSGVQRSAVDQALESKNGHLDLFLRFFLGLSVDSPLPGLVSDPLIGSRSSKSIEGTVQYIKMKIKEESSAERTINLFHCLNELNNDSLVEEIQNSLRSGKLSDKNLETDQCSALAYVLLMSPEIVDDFDLRTYNTSAAGYKRLVPVVRNCRKAIMNCCHLTKASCEIMTSALQSSNSPLRDLDLSYNNLGDSGVELLCAGLMSQNCKLQRLGLRSCELTERSAEIVASALQSSNSPLRDLDLGGNFLEDAGVKLLCVGLMSCKLKTLGLRGCQLTERSCESVTSALQSSNSPLRGLDLSYNYLGDSGVELLCVGLMSLNCKLQTLGLGWCNLTERCCDVLASVLNSPHSELRDLELRDNELQDSGVRALSAALEDPQCKLQRLGLSGCRVTQRGCDYLASALCSNPSHLKELELSYNHPGDTGVSALSAAKLDSLTLLWLSVHTRSNTAHRALSLSEGNRKVTHRPEREEQPYPDHQEKFDTWEQVLCRESVCERCYWEAEWSVSEGVGGVSIAVAYKGISRKGKGSDCGFGWNKNSWSLRCFKHSDSDLKYSVWHNRKQTLKPAPSSPYLRPGVCDDDGACRVCVYRVGVCVDLPNGTLSFYSISDPETQTLLHRFHTQFTQHTPLCAGFTVRNSSVSLCHVE